MSPVENSGRVCEMKNMRKVARFSRNSVLKQIFVSLFIIYELMHGGEELGAGV